MKEFPFESFFNNKYYFLKIALINFLIIFLVA